MYSWKNYCNANNDSVIDLTESLNENSVIELDTTNESFNITLDSDAPDERIINVGSSKKHIKSTSRRKNKNKKRRCTDLSKDPASEDKNSRPPGGLIGECPICWDSLEKNPLASTKCGHVYCLKCLEQSLKSVKKCPTCRCVLKGSSSYHPLYLNR